jgi:hypothetical protein
MVSTHSLLKHTPAVLAWYRLLFSFRPGDITSDLLLLLHRVLSIRVRYASCSRTYYTEYLARYTKHVNTMHATQNKSKAVRRTAAPAHKEAGPATRRRTLVGSSSSLGGFYRTASPLVGSLSSFSVYMWVLARLPCWWVLSSFSLGGF